jgi:hypothetical protein
MGKTAILQQYFHMVAASDKAPNIVYFHFALALFSPLGHV